MAALDAWLVLEDEAGFSMTPPTTRTWSRRGHTPVIRVQGRSRRRLSMAALVCYRAGEHSRLIYRPCPDRRPDERKSFSWTDYRDLIQTAHHQLGSPIMLVWDKHAEIDAWVVTAQQAFPRSWLPGCPGTRQLTQRELRRSPPTDQGAASRTPARIPDPLAPGTRVITN